jgi:glycosyltransferase involved in cell wall biosynthesis
MPRVSVVVATYNAREFIAATLDALLAQTFRDFEIVVVDDASTDGTPGIVQGYRDPRIRLIRNAANAGVARARNIGFAAAVGEYVASNDHDDVSLPGRLAAQVDFLDRHPDVLMVAAGTATLVDGRRRADPVPPLVHHLIRWGLMTHSPLCHSTMCLRRQRMLELGLAYDPARDFGDDFDLYHRMAAAARLAALPEPLVLYRLHEANASRVHGQEMNARGRAMLADAHRRHLGIALADAELDALWRIVTGFHAAASRDELMLAGRSLVRVLEAFLAAVPLDERERTDVAHAAGRQWWDAVNRAANRLGEAVLECHRSIPALSGYSPGIVDALRRRVGRTLRHTRRALLGAAASR